ncbi:hypothetical protein [Streptosporangium minutum]|uniref:hypothetical protein n=1 Tax=Streptosporangium minutum TaxID=569862 RepID=UPI000D52668E|nr:hypothetical protein [Streptosporangium minutum]
MGGALTRWRILIGLGRIAEAERDAGQARLRYRQALATARAYGDRPAVAASAEALAAVAAFDAAGR